jgi:two-component system, LytTR family, response regulator
MENINNLQTFSFLTVNHKQQIRIHTDNIVMLEGHNNYTLIHLKNGKKQMYSKTISHFEEQLENEHFIRCHRAFLVNPLFIIGYDKEAAKLYLMNNLIANISRRKHGQIGDILKFSFIVD